MYPEVSTHFRQKIGHYPFYRDLRPHQNDKRILRNPHKGWYIHYLDNGMKWPVYRDGIEEGDYLTDFPGLNHLYLRFDWGDIERERGVYDWSYIDKTMETWGAKGYAFTFRLCLYEPGINPWATPKWLYDLGCPGTFFETKKEKAFEPDYGNSLLLEHLERMMAEMGRRYNGRIEFLDVGTYGTWGEGHTWGGSRRVWPSETIIKHINMHLKYFPGTIVMLNDDHITEHDNKNHADAQRLLDYAVTRGLGLRDDSICVDDYCDIYGYNTVDSPWLFDLFWRQAPVDIELGHYNSIKDERLKSCFPYLQSLIDTHATYSGFHGYPRPWLERHRDFTEYAANRLGYWYILEGIEVPPLVSGLPVMITLHVDNRGFAPAYHHYDARMRLIDKSGFVAAEFPFDIDNRSWLPGHSAPRALVRLPDVPAGDYDLSFGLFYNNRPVELGMELDLYRDGYCQLCGVEVESRL